jgi:hypothetical protein
LFWLTALLDFPHHFPDPKERISMSFQLSIPKELESTWRPVIEHQFNLLLAPLRVSLQNPRVSFSRLEDPAGERYFCELIVRMPHGERLQLSAQHTDARTALIDVFSRARRAAGRRRWRVGEQKGVRPTGSALPSQ